MNETVLLTDPLGKLLYGALFALTAFLLKRYDLSLGEKIKDLKSGIEAFRLEIKEHKKNVCNSMAEYENSLNAHYKKSDGEVRAIAHQLNQINSELKIDYSALQAKTASLGTQVELMIGDVKHANTFVREHYGKIIWIEETYRKNGRILQEVKNGIVKSEGAIEELQKGQQENRQSLQKAKQVFTAYGAEIKAIKAELTGHKKKGL